MIRFPASWSRQLSWWDGKVDDSLENYVMLIAYISIYGLIPVVVSFGTSIPFFICISWSSWFQGTHLTWGEVNSWLSWTQKDHESCCCLAAIASRCPLVHGAFGCFLNYIGHGFNAFWCVSSKTLQDFPRCSPKIFQLNACSNCSNSGLNPYFPGIRAQTIFFVQFWNMRFVAPYHHYHSGEFWGTLLNLQYSVNTCSGAISDMEIEMA